MANGILSGMPNGILDPTNAALLSAGFGMMRASGPSRLPVSLGQVIGQGGQQGLQSYQDTQMGNLQQQIMKAQMDEIRRKQEAMGAFSSQFPHLGAVAGIAPQVAAQAAIPDQQPGFTLGPEQVRYDAMGRPLAQGPAAAPKAPMTRKVRRGDKEVTQSYVSGKWQDDEVGEAFSPRPLVDVKVPVNLAGNKYAEVVGTKSAERDITQHDVASSAVDNIAKLDTVLAHLQSSDAITGMGSELLLNLERAKQLVMKDEASGKKVSDTELLDSLLGSDVFPMIKALGIGARGLDTPAEREFLRKVMTGTTPMNKETLLRMTKMRRDISARAIEKWNTRVGTGELDRYFELTQSPKRKLELPSAPQTKTPTTRPNKGDVVEGWEFIGGDPGNRMNWRRAK